MTVSREQIVADALSLLSASGIEGLSMRAVAARLGVTPMALYRHVRDKEDLEDAILDLVLGQLEIPPRTVSWPDRLRALAHSGRRLINDNPAVANLIFTRVSRYSRAVSFVDAIYLAILDAGVPVEQVARLERMTTTFTLGYAASEASGRFTSDEVRADRGVGFAGHERLSETLSAAPDWNEEFETDVNDLIAIIQSWVITSGVSDQRAT